MAQTNERKPRSRTRPMHSTYNCTGFHLRSPTLSALLKLRMSYSDPIHASVPLFSIPLACTSGYGTPCSTFLYNLEAGGQHATHGISVNQKEKSLPCFGGKYVEETLTRGSEYWIQG